MPCVCCIVLYSKTLCSLLSCRVEGPVLDPASRYMDGITHTAFNAFYHSYFSVSFPLSSNKQDADGAWLANAAEEWGQIAEGALCGRDFSFHCCASLCVQISIKPSVTASAIISTSQNLQLPQQMFKSTLFHFICWYNLYNYDYKIICAWNKSL